MTGGVLVLCDVTFEADDGTSILRGVSLTVPAGAAVGISGGDASGKTCLLRISAGLLAPSGGSVEVAGTRFPSPGTRVPARAVRAAQSRLGLIPQEGGLLSNLTLRENVFLPLRYHGRMDGGTREHLDRLVERTGLGPLLDRLPADVPHGARRKALLVRALAPRPVLLLADHAQESGTDEGTRMAREAIDEGRAEWGMALVATARSPARARLLADRVHALEAGMLRPVDPEVP